MGWCTGTDTSQALPLRGCFAFVACRPGGGGGGGAAEGAVALCVCGGACAAACLPRLLLLLLRVEGGRGCGAVATCLW